MSTLFSVMTSVILVSAQPAKAESAVQDIADTAAGITYDATQLRKLLPYGRFQAPYQAVFKQLTLLTEQSRAIEDHIDRWGFLHWHEVESHAETLEQEFSILAREHRKLRASSRFSSRFRLLRAKIYFLVDQVFTLKSEKTGNH